MQTQITNALNIGGIILFKDGSKKFITIDQFKNLIKSNEDNFVIDGNKYNFFSVKKILDTKEYYQEYPNEKLEVKKDYSFEKPIKRTMEKWVRGMEGLIKGYKSYFEGREMNGEQKLFLMKMDRKLWERRRKFNNPVDEAKALMS